MDDDAALRSWLSSLPNVTSPDAALEILGALATRIADELGVPSAAALPAGRHAVADSAPDAALVPAALGVVWETMMHDRERRLRGAHFTPVAVAEEICRLAVGSLERPDPWTVWDPAVGGGAFLLAAATVIEERTGLERAAIVGRLHGTDIDPIAVAIADAALELWSGCGARPRVERLDPLLDDGHDWPQSGFDLVVGNPPFLGQLSGDTVRGTRRRAALVDRYGDAASGYVDEASLFLLRSVDRCREGGVVSLVLPQSMLGAADSRAVRAAVAASGALRSLWVESDSAFDAAVDVVAPVVVTGAGTVTTEVVHRGRRTTVATPGDESWAPLMAPTLGIPAVHVSGEETLGDLATVTAGFRQHFYGIADAVMEQEDAPPEHRMLITAGTIEPLNPSWGRIPTRFGGRRWSRPVLVPGRIRDAAVAEWFAERARPKVLVATQTRIVEAIADPDGVMAPSVPVISVEPFGTDVWSVAALLSAPAISAHLAGRGAGTGLSSRAMRVRAADLAELPVPDDRGAWVEGAVLAAAVQEATAGDRWTEYAGLLDELASCLLRAYRGESDTLREWWWAGVRFPAPADRGILEHPAP